MRLPLKYSDIHFDNLSSAHMDVHAGRRSGRYWIRKALYFLGVPARPAKLLTRLSFSVKVYNQPNAPWQIAQGWERTSRGRSRSP
jgi:hypothetical protein